MDTLKLRQVLFEDCRLDPQKPVLLGFSGGPDSLYLLHLLKEAGIEFIAAHLDHGMRASSAVEAKRAEVVCSMYGIPCILERADVATHARSRKISLEEAARDLRYEFLFKAAGQTHAQAVLVAHHADDQLETVLMHLLRGSGLSGLAGMRPVLLPNPWSGTIPLVRPLLSVEREEISRYLQEHGLEPILDESNRDPQFFRNRIRVELVHELQTYNPRIKQRILNMAEVVGVENDYLQAEVNTAWQHCEVLTGNHFLVLDRARLVDLHPAIQRRLMRQAISWMDPELRDIEFDHIEKAARFCRKVNQAKRIDLLDGIELFSITRGRVVFAFRDDPLHDLWPQVETEGQLLIPGSYRISPQWGLHASIEDSYSPVDERYVGQMDAQKLQGPLKISRFHAGDEFQPFGLDGKTVKVGEFWTNEGLPARARQNWPVIRSGELIVWLPGFRISEQVKVDRDTRQVIRIECQKEESAA